MKNVVALLTALLLLVSQTGLWSAPPAPRPCCHNCAGACCVQSTGAPLPAAPLAPVSSPTASVLKLAVPPALVRAEPILAPVVSVHPAPAAPLLFPQLPLFLRQCVLLV